MKNSLLKLKEKAWSKFTVNGMHLKKKEKYKHLNYSYIYRYFRQIDIYDILDYLI